MVFNIYEKKNFFFVKTLSDLIKKYVNHLKIKISQIIKNHYKKMARSLFS